MPSINFVLNRLSLTSSREELRSVAYALGEWLVARDEPALSASYDRLRSLRNESPPDSPARASFDALTQLLEGYFASAEGVRHLERLIREVEHEPLWREILEALAKGALNQEQICGAVKRAKSTVSVACEDLRRRELIELVPVASRRENVHELTSVATQVLGRMSVAETVAARPAAAASSSARSAGSSTRSGRTSAPPSAAPVVKPNKVVVAD